MCMAPVVRLLALLTIAIPAAAQAQPRLPAEARSAEGFVPRGWHIETRAVGDLDGAGAPDLAFILLHGPDVPVGMPREDEWGLRTGPPRILVIALAQPGGGYRLAVQDAALLPPRRPPNGLSEGWMLFEDGSLSISRRRLRVIFEYTRSHLTFTFRRERGAFRLIGFDTGGVSGGCVQSLSVNLLTHRAKVTAGYVDRDEERVRWRRVPPRPLVALGAMGAGEDFDPYRLLTGFSLSCPERE